MPRRPPPAGVPPKVRGSGSGDNVDRCGVMHSHRFRETHHDTCGTDTTPRKPKGSGRISTQTMWEEGAFV